MTRLYNDCWQCPECGIKHAKETLFKQWVRANPLLESRDGNVIYDFDFMVHKYKTIKGRDLQFLMFIETKTYGANMSQSQRDTMYVLDQLTRNRKKNMHSAPKRQSLGTPTKAYSVIAGKDVAIRCFGVHLLTFEKNGPQDSDWIKWDKTVISNDQLTGLLNFDIDPDNLGPMDTRLHHQYESDYSPLFANNY